jgi:hypothetical protein
VVVTPRGPVGIVSFGGVIIPVSGVFHERNQSLHEGERDIHADCFGVGAGFDNLDVEPRLRRGGREEGVGGTKSEGEGSQNAE